MSLKKNVVGLLTFVLLGCVLTFASAASPQARASHILVDSEKDIDALYQQIQASKDIPTKFAELAQAKSKCPSGRRGGDLGSFGRGQMVPEFDKVVFEKEVGKVHKVKTQFGWHLVLTTERTGMDDSAKGSSTSTKNKESNKLDHDSFKYKALTFINQYIGVLGPLLFIGTLWLVGRRTGGGSGLRARASHILVETEAEVDELLKEIQAAEDKKGKFAELAKAKSKCPSGQKGGDLGSFGRGQMVPQFDKVVFEKEVGEIHKVQTQFGWHLVFTTERTGDAKKSD